MVETYETERIKVVSVWSEFTDQDLHVRPHQSDPRGRSVHEQMVHQCVSEDLWFRNMLGIDVGAPPLPHEETRLEFIKRYAEDRTVETLQPSETRRRVVTVPANVEYEPTLALMMCLLTPDQDQRSSTWSIID